MEETARYETIRLAAVALLPPPALFDPAQHAAREEPVHPEPPEALDMLDDAACPGPRPLGAAFPLPPRGKPRFEGLELLLPLAVPEGLSFRDLARVRGEERVALGGQSLALLGIGIGPR